MLVVSLFFLTPVCLSAETALPVLTSDSELATAGYYQLSWQPGSGRASNKTLTFEVQQSTDREFLLIKTVYRGSDRASVLSGQSDGLYFYRVRVLYPDQTASEWSEAVLVKVQHHSLQKAWLFFIAGAIVFLIILFFIIFAARDKGRLDS